MKGKFGLMALMVFWLPTLAGGAERMDTTWEKELVHSLSVVSIASPKYLASVQKRAERASGRGEIAFEVMAAGFLRCSDLELAGICSAALENAGFDETREQDFDSPRRRHVYHFARGKRDVVYELRLIDLATLSAPVPATLPHRVYTLLKRVRIPSASESPKENGNAEALPFVFHEGDL